MKADKAPYLLPNGMRVYYRTEAELKYLFQDIFIDQVYLRHGVCIRENDCIFDVGANIGLFTLFIHARHCAQNIYVFEPIPSVYELMIKNLRLHGLAAHAFRHGLSDKPGDARFIYYPNYSILSGMYGDPVKDEAMLKRLIRHAIANNCPKVDGKTAEDYARIIAKRKTEAQTITCRVSTLSHVMAAHSIERIDLLKIDAEKSELDILRGIDEKDWHKIRQIVLEVHDEGGLFLDQISGLLDQKGYTFHIDQQKDHVGSAGIYLLYAARPSGQ
ncbi:MAG: FkbM family methyltransferase [Kiritimatiellae bacterium]|nr:FkbM family methyltransferase [Kiritimatiellia bacterium]